MVTVAHSPIFRPATNGHTLAEKEISGLGTDWLEAGATAVLSVPSAIVADESNYLLNPLHADFTEIRIGKARAFVLDGRSEGKEGTLII